ncbi:MAG TPA: phospho-N-acetylmuramoyl-pentapeptide-transferase [Anaerolineales bacterium]|nr:phospho-N-acetylmuramoyl-pentapeptide-transferase [Anaerolineales bacterium]
MNFSTLAVSFAGISFIMTIIWGEPFLRLLRYFKVGKQVRVEEPGQHLIKMGTPTMGGLMVIIPVIFLSIMINAVALIGSNATGHSILIPLFTLVSFGILGGIDDWEGIYGKRKGDGMTARVKFISQWVLALSIAWALKFVLRVPDLYIPGLRVLVDFGWWFIPIAAFLIVGYSNAINLTDGLDGLAGLISATIFAGYGLISLFQGQIVVAQFCFTMVGALFGFLWFNVHPAQLFMGDAGALAIGAAVAVVALMTGQWAVLPLITIIPVSETLSVIIQVAYFKLTHGQRFFKMTPIHLHFELLGWSETQVVQRFWLISLLGTFIGVGLAIS